MAKNKNNSQKESTPMPKTIGGQLLDSGAEEKEITDLQKKAGHETRKEKMEGMSFKQKIIYFWDYEKWYVIIPIVSILIVASLIGGFIRAHKERTLVVTVVNSYMDDANSVTFDRNYMEARGLDQEKVPFEVETDFVFPEVMDEVGASDNFAVASIQKFQALLMSEGMDVTIATDWVLEEYEVTDSFCNMEEILAPEVFEKLKDKMFYCKDSTGALIPIGVYADEFPEISKLYEKQPIIAVFSNAKHIENGADFIAWLAESM